MALLTNDEVRQLERMTLAPATTTPMSNWLGTRVGRTRGPGTEFHDFRPYQPGDDPRTIDWNIHARLRQLVVRVARADARFAVHLLVDTSRSMAVGRPDKLSCAVRLAAALAYTALKRRDAVGLASFDSTARPLVAPSTGSLHGRLLLEALGSLTPSGTSVATALRDYAATVHGPGLAVVLSDFLQADGPLTGLRALRQRGLTTAVVHIVASEERDPLVEGEVELVDSEGAKASLVVDDRSVPFYRAHLRRHVAELGEFCGSTGSPWIDADASTPFGALLESCVAARLLESVG